MSRTAAAAKMAARHKHRSLAPAASARWRQLRQRRGALAAGERKPAASAWQKRGSGDGGAQSENGGAAA